MLHVQDKTNQTLIFLLNKHFLPYTNAFQVFDFMTHREMLLKTDSSGIDVSSHAAAYLVLLAADGPEAWTVEDPTREAVLKDVETTIDRWQLDASRGVKFRYIRKTCPCNIYPLKPHFYIVKLGFAGVYLFFLFLLQNIDCSDQDVSSRFF